MSSSSSDWIAEFNAEDIVAAFESSGQAQLNGLLTDKGLAAARAACETLLQSREREDRSWMCVWSVPRHLAAPHAILRHPRLRYLAARLLGKPVGKVTVTLNVKYPDVFQPGQEVPWHQDREGMLTIYVALDDASPDSGGMSLAPEGWHLRGELPTQIAPFGRELAWDQLQLNRSDFEASAVRHVLSPGSATVHHPLLPHASVGPMRRSAPLKVLLLRYLAFDAPMFSGPQPDAVNDLSLDHFLSIFMGGGSSRWDDPDDDDRPPSPPPQPDLVLTVGVTRVERSSEGSIAVACTNIAGDEVATVTIEATASPDQLGLQISQMLGLQQQRRGVRFIMPDAQFLSGSKPIATYLKWSCILFQGVELSHGGLSVTDAGIYGFPFVDVLQPKSNNAPVPLPAKLIQLQAPRRVTLSKDGDGAIGVTCHFLEPFRFFGHAQQVALCPSAVIAKVADGSPAAGAGLCPGMHLLEVGGFLVHHEGAFKAALKRAQDDAVEVVITEPVGDVKTVYAKVQDVGVVAVDVEPSTTVCELHALSWAAAKEVEVALTDIQRRRTQEIEVLYSVAAAATLAQRPTLPSKALQVIAAFLLEGFTGRAHAAYADEAKRSVQQKQQDLNRLCTAVRSGKTFIDSQWLYTALLHGDRYGRHSVKGILGHPGRAKITSTQLNAGGLTSRMFQVKYCFSTGSSDSFIVKVPVEFHHPAYHAITQARSYAREVAAYEALFSEGSTPLGAPKCFASSPDGTFLVLQDLFEVGFITLDMLDAKIATEVAMSTWYSVACAALQSVAAGLHAPWYSGGLKRQGAREECCSRPPYGVWPLLPAPASVADTSDRILLARAAAGKPDVLDLCSELERSVIVNALSHSNEALRAVIRAARMPSVAPWECTLIHGDLQQGNVMFQISDRTDKSQADEGEGQEAPSCAKKPRRQPDGGDSPNVSIIDWQTLRTGGVATDFVALMTCAPTGLWESLGSSLLTAYAESFFMHLRKRQKKRESSDWQAVQQSILPDRVIRLVALAQLLNALADTEAFRSFCVEGGCSFALHQARVQRVAAFAASCDAVQTAAVFALARPAPGGHHVIEVEPPTLAAEAIFQGTYRDPLSAHTAALMSTFRGSNLGPGFVRLHEGPEAFCIEECLPRWYRAWGFREVVVSLELLEHKPKHKHSVVFGVFDRLHNGHRCLLTVAAWQGEKITVALSADGTPVMRAKHKAEMINPFSSRQAALYAFFASTVPQVEVSVIELKESNYAQIKTELMSDEARFFTSKGDLDTMVAELGTGPRVIGVPIAIDWDGNAFSSTRLRSSVSSSSLNAV